MKPSIAFVIVRMNWYRHMAPAIDAALARGWRVECWHDVGNPMLGRPLDFPKVEWAPAFRNGQPIFREYCSSDKLAEWILQKQVDAVINLWPLFGARLSERSAKSKRSLCVLIEPSPADWFLHVTDPEELRQIDLFALTTSFWLEQDVQLMKESLPFPFTAKLEEEVRRKSVIVGWPQIDQLGMIDPKEVRQRWGIPSNQPVVVYLNWSAGDFALFPVTSPVGRIKAILSHPGRWGSAFKLLRGHNLEQVTKALRTFCDRNGTYLIVKYRNRDQILSPEERMADRVLTDTTYYPHTILEAMSIANLSVSYFSYGVRESVGAGAPHLVLNESGLDGLILQREREPFNRRYSQPNGFWNFKGVVWKMDSRDIIGKLPRMALADFEVDRTAATDYYKKYLGAPGVSNSDLFLDAVERLIESSPRGRLG